MKKSKIPSNTTVAQINQSFNTLDNMRDASTIY